MKPRQRVCSLGALGTLAAAILCIASPAFASVTLASPNLTALSSGLVGYWPLDGATTNWAANTTADLSGQGNTGTLVSLATSSAPAVGKIGGALNFNGSASNISVPNSAGINPASTITVSVWIKPGTSATSDIIEKAGCNGYYLEIVAAAVAWGKQCVGTNQTSASNVIKLNAWNYVVSTYDGTTLNIYINGVLKATKSTAFTFANNGVLEIGKGLDGFFPGAIDDVRVYNRALSAQEIALLYAAGQFTQGGSNTTTLSAGLVGYWPLDGSSINWKADTTADLSGQGDTGTLFSFSTSTSPTIGKIDGALKFNGVNNYISLGSGLTNLNNAVTISAWVKKTADVAWASIVDRYGSETLDCLSFGFDSTNGQKLMFMWNNAAPFNNRVVANSVIPLNQWVFVGASSDGSNVTFYVNGVPDGTVGAGTPCTSGPLEIGVNFPGGDEYLAGSLDDVRIYNRALSAQEMQELYKEGAATIGQSNTNTQSGVGINSGLVGYWTMDGTNINWRTNTIADSSGQGNTGTLVSLGTSTAPTIGKIGQALKFNGSTSQYIQAAWQAGIGTSNQAYTISTWIKPSVSTETGDVLHIAGGATARDGASRCFK